LWNGLNADVFASEECHSLDTSSDCESVSQKGAEAPLKRKKKKKKNTAMEKVSKSTETKKTATLPVVH